jgi:hypothetical protein
MTISCSAASGIPLEKESSRRSNKTTALSMKISLDRGAVFCALLIASTLSLFGQGSLTPPGAPTPTMKTLDQVKPGIPIDPGKAGFTTPYNISAPGSYYLAGNIAVASGNAIVISASGVTLDLNGFTISSTANPIGGSAVLVNYTLNNITILNGFIVGNVTNTGSGSGFSYGIIANEEGQYVWASNVRVTGVSVSGCGHGIFAGPSSAVEGCKVYTTASAGILGGTVKGCTAINCGDIAVLGSQVSDCSGQSTSNFGISAGTIQNSDGSSVSGAGLDCTTAHNCKGSSGSGTGIQVQSAVNCHATSNSGTAFSVFSGGSLTACTADASFGPAHGIVAADACTITACAVTKGAVGINAGKNSVVTNCVVQSSTGNGITVGVGSSVTGCTVSGSTGNGIVLGDRSLAQNCVASGNTGDGITMTVECSVLNCNACTNTGNGIHLLGGTDSNNRVDGNNASNNTAIGILQHGGPDLIVRNMARSNGSGTNYSPSSGTSVGPIGTPNTATSPWANFQ